MKTDSLRKIYRMLPEVLRILIFKLVERIPGTPQYERRSWILNTYTAFGRQQRKNIFLSIARFCNINRPIDGYYMEFGSHEANTMRIAWDCTKHLFNWHYIAFDSFEGLPEIAAIDRQEIWQKGRLKTAVEEFVDIVTSHGMPRERLTVVKGFYNQTLTPELSKKLQPRKAAVVYVDCDLYVSTVDVLNFAKDFFQRGTILVFDDWFCFHGDPEKGERLAFREFCEANPNMIFEDFVQTNEGKAYIYLGERSASK